LLTRNVGVVNGNAGDLQPRVNETVEGPRRVNLNAGIRIEEPIDATPLTASVPKPFVDGYKRNATAREKSKGQVIESTLPQPVLTTGLPSINMFDAAQASTEAEMWRGMCATEMTLGGQQMGTSEATAGTKTARALDFGVTIPQQTPVEDENLRMTLAGASMATPQPIVVTLSTEFPFNQCILLNGRANG